VNKLELKEAFEKALKFEQNGYNIYSETAKKTQNPIVKKTFKYLADQELFHIDEIKGYIAAIDADIEFKGDDLEKTKEFFKTTTEEFKEKTELSDDDIKAHEAGLHLEKSAYNFYKEQHDLIDNEEIKKFFKWLMEQESAHYNLIDKSYQFIKDPVGFYSEEERWSVDGG